MPKETVELKPEKSKPSLRLEMDKDEVKGYALGDEFHIEATGIVKGVNSWTPDNKEKFDVTFGLSDIDLKSISDEDRKEAESKDIDIKRQKRIKELREKNKGNMK